MKFLGMEPPKISLANSNLRAARQRLHFDPAIAELPVPAGLLFVAALDVGLPANGLAIRNFGRFQGDIHTVALLHAADHDFHVLLARARQQELARLRVAVKAQRLVFFENSVDRLAHAVLVVAGLGLDGERDGRLRQFHRRIADIRPLFLQGVAGEGVLQFGHRADIAGVDFGHRLRVFPWGLAICASRSVLLCATLSRLASFFTVPVITLK